MNSQDAFLKTIATVSEIKLELNARKSLHIEYKMTSQPLIFMVAESMNFYTVYEDIIYKFDSLIHATASALKIHNVFNIDYQKECSLVWKFIKIWLFEFPAPTSSTSLSTLLSYMSQNTF